MKQRNDQFRLLADLLLVIPGVLGAVFCLITAFDLPVPGALPWVSVTAILLFSLFLGNRKQDLMTPLILLAFLLVATFLTRHELVEGFRTLWGILSSTFAMGYSFFADLVPEEPWEIEAVEPAILALTVLEAYLCCLSVRVWRRTIPSALVMLICIGPCFVLTDTPPDTLPLLAAVFSVLVQAFSQSVRRREEGEHFKAVSVSALLSAVLLAIVLLFFPQKDFAPPITWSQLSKSIQKIGDQIENGGNTQAGLSGNQETVDLASLRALPNRPIPVLFVTASEDAYLYLRGASYTNFDGVHWTHGPQYERGQAGLFPYLGWKDGATLSVESVGHEELIYTAYQLTQMPGGGTVVSDSYIKNVSDTTKYTMHFLQNPDPLTPNPDYDKWVRTYCLSLPEKTRTGVLEWWKSQVPPAMQTITAAAGTEEQMQFAEFVASQVSKCASYSRNPAKAPSDVDFCTWFLTQAEEGYCVHYATSCTALLRALGIPARYVSGYVCDAKATIQASVTNLQAHAWVEIWVGGRWVNIEPTPEDATEFTGVLPDSGTHPSNTEASEDPDYTRPDHLPRDLQPTTPTTEPPALPGGNGSSTPSKPVDLTALWVFLGIIAVPCLFVGRRILKLRLWGDRIARAAANDRARLLYRRMLRLEKLGGGKISADAAFLAKKACFSQHTLTDTELAVLRQVCEEQGSRLQICGLWKRLYCKYILAVI